MSQPEVNTATDEREPVENGAAESPRSSNQVLKNVLESLIFVSDKPVSAKALARTTHSTLAEVQPLLDELVSDYQHRGVHLYFIAGGYQFRSSGASSEFVKSFVAPRPIRLTRAQLETLAIVAYRQPITRPEIDEVRGVDSGSAIGMLAERKLVKILGRKDEPGRPLVYGTTARFLEFFGLSSLQDLPTLQEFSDLTDEHKALFEIKTGEPIDLVTAELEATKAQAEAEEELRVAEAEAAIQEGPDSEAEPDSDSGADVSADSGAGSEATAEPSAGVDSGPAPGSDADFLTDTDADAGAKT